jgi:hypothetical protein
VWYRAERVCEVALVFRHVLPLHNYLEPLNLQLVLSRRVSLDLIMEAGGDDPRTRGQLASLDLSFFKLRPNRPVCVFITAGPSTKLFAWGGGGYGRTCATRDNDISLPCSSFQINASRSLRIASVCVFLSFFSFKLMVFNEKLLNCAWCGN